jgi:hypothetical protein
MMLTSPRHLSGEEVVMKCLHRSTLVLCLAASTFALVGFSDGALIVRDWQVPGDGALTLDTATGLQWLDLTVAAQRSVIDVSGQLCQGCEFAGFRYAHESEVRTLLSHADIPGQLGDWDSINYEPILDLQELIGLTRASFGETFGATGDQGASTAYVLGIGIQQQSNPASSVFEQGRVLTNDVITPDRTAFIGHWLVTPVPEPSTALLMGLGIAGLASRRY